MVKYNNKEITKIKYNGKEIVKAYYNNHIVFSKSTPPTPGYIDLDEIEMEDNGQYLIVPKIMEPPKKVNYKGTIKYIVSSEAIEKYGIAQIVTHYGDDVDTEYKSIETQPYTVNLDIKIEKFYTTIYERNIKSYLDAYDENFTKINMFSPSTTEKEYDESQPKKVVFRRYDSDDTLLYTIVFENVTENEVDLNVIDITLDPSEMTTDIVHNVDIGKYSENTLPYNSMVHWYIRTSTTLHNGYNIKYGYSKNYLVILIFNQNKVVSRRTPLYDGLNKEYQKDIAAYRNLTFALVKNSLEKDEVELEINSISYEIIDDVFTIKGYVDGELAIEVELTTFNLGYVMQ